MDQPRGNIILLGSAALALACGLIIYQLFDGDSGNAANSSASTQSSASQRQKILQGNFAQWELRIGDAKTDGLRSLMEEAMRISDPELRLMVVTALVDRWLAEDAAGFTKYWASLQVDGVTDKLAVLASALEFSLTKLSPELATSDEILVIVQRLIAYLSSSDPEKALVWAKQWLLDDAFENAMVSIIRNLAAKDVSKAVAAIDEMTSPLRRSQAVAALAAVWATKDLKAATAWARNLPNVVERAMAMNSVLLVAAQQDAGASADELRSLANEINDQYLRDRKAELEKLGITEADLAEDSESYKEMEAAGTLPPPYSPDVELLGEASRIIAAKLASGDIAGALDYAESLDSDFLKMKALSGTLEGWGKDDPNVAVGYLNEHFPANVDLYNALYKSWAADNYANAAEGTRLITDPSTRAQALESVLYDWGVRGDVDGMLDFVSKLSPAEFTDTIKASTANAISTHSPQDAWNIALTIGNENAQLRALRSAFSSMVIENADTAGQALASVTLPQKASSTLQDMLIAVKGE